MDEERSIGEVLIWTAPSTFSTLLIAVRLEENPGGKGAGVVDRVAFSVAIISRERLQGRISIMHASAPFNSAQPLAFFFSSSFMALQSTRAREARGYVCMAFVVKKHFCSSRASKGLLYIHTPGSK